MIFSQPHDSQPMLSVGIKMITKTHTGLEIKAHKTVVIEIMDGDELASFDLPLSGARVLAQRLVEFADAIEIKEAS